ncbi:chemosensory receptor B [Elysia marginata]|uniref:Chemosensory receptor B n=1 Tax=Elysia marginata TaxID=1093978 RepID=A0AAV4ITH2_9GAST|nr:chemosensory receptor B [Elysia marginata]
MPSINAEDTTELWSRTSTGHILGGSEIVSNEVLETFQIINYLVLSTFISAFGIAGNIINVIVYWRIGFKESITVTLFVLSISDLSLVIVQLFCSLCLTPGFRKTSDIGLLLYELTYGPIGVVRSCWCRMSMCITVLITVERCVCIKLPTKVKIIFTPKRAVAMVVICAIVICLSALPIYLSYYVGRRPVQGTNETRLVMLRTSSAEAMTEVSWGTSLCIQILSIALIGISVFTLLITLVRQRRTLRSGSVKLANTRTFPESQRNRLLSKAPLNSTFKSLVTYINDVSIDNPYQRNQLGPSIAERERDIMGVHGAAGAHGPVQSVQTVSCPPSALAGLTNQTPIQDVKQQLVQQSLAKASQYLKVQYCQSSYPCNLTQAPSTDERPSTSSQPDTPRCVPVISGSDMVTRVTQQRSWRVGKMIATLSLILFVSCIPSTALLALHPAMSSSKRY